MFKKLKEKVIDSQTSQKFQQITQSVSDKFQNMDKEENFFSLTEDDNAIGSPTLNSMEPGFSNISLTPQSNMNRNRKTSTSSMASDISFLPRYDSVSSIYHLQSDLDISASEVEDNGSTASSQIGHLSKEQIYAAFQKSQMRYHKYRGRYTDIANHYKNLEREFAKLKTELEKTQERSFRRVKELKEQCELEQKAKAHLESSLRVDLDEKQIQINTLKEKITLLQNGPNLNIDLEQLTKNLNEAKQENENLNSANQEMKAKLIVLQSKEDEYKEKIKKFGEDIERLKEDERENNLKLAQSKMEIHNEMLSKEAELNSLQQENESLKKSLDAYEKKPSGNSKMEQLQSQNKNLIEKVENLSQKCQSLSNEMLKVEQYKMEINNLKTKISEEKNAHDQEIIEITKEAEGFKEKLFKEKQEKEDMIDDLEKIMFKNKESNEKDIEDLKKTIQQYEEMKNKYEEQINKIREDAKKALLSIEEKIKRKFEEEFKEKEEKMKIEFEEKFKSVSSQGDDIKQLQIKLLSVTDELKGFEENKSLLEKSLEEKTVKYRELEKSYLEVNEDLTVERGKFSKLEKKLQEFDGIGEKVIRLQANITTLQQENAQLNDLCKEQNENFEKLRHEKLNVENKLEKLEEEFKLFQTKKNTESVEENECKILRLKIETLEEERNNSMHEFCALEEEFKKLSEYNNHDKKKIDEYKQKIEENSRKEEDFEALLKEKNNFENILKNLNEDLKLAKMKLRTRETEENECKILEFKLKELGERYEDTLKAKEKKTEENLELQRLLENLNEEISKKQNNVKIEEDYKNLLKERDDTEKLYVEVKEKLKIAEMKLGIKESDRNESKMLDLKLRELQQKYDELIRRNEEITAKNLSAERRISELENMLKETEDSLKNKNMELKEVNTILENIQNSTSDEAEELHTVLEDLKEKYKKSEELLEEKILKINELTKEIEVKIQYIKNLEENYKILDKNEKHLIKELEVCKNETDRKSKDLVKLENNFAEIQKLYSTEKKDIMKQINNLKQVEKNYYSLLDENENLKEQISEIVLLQEKLKALSAVETEKKNLEVKLCKMEDNVRSLEEENVISKKKLANFQSLSDNFAKLETERKGLEEEVSKLAKISQEKDELEKKFVDVTNILKNLEETHLRLQEEYDTLKNATKSEKEEFNSKYQSVEAKYEELLQEKSLLLQQLSALVEDKVKLEATIKNLSEDMEITNAIREEVKILKNEKEDLCAKILKIEISKKELESMGELNNKEKNELLEKISELKKQILEVNKEKQNLEESCSHNRDVDSKYNRLVSELDEVNRNLNKLKEENEVLKQSNKQVSSDNKHISEENSNLLGELEELKLNIENYSAVKVELEEKEIKLNKEKDELSLKLEKATEDITALRNENRELREIKINKVNSEVEFLDAQQNYYEIKTKFDELSIENKKLKSDIDELGKTIDNFKEEKRKYENTINELERHQNELLNEKQLLKEEIEELKITPINLNSANTPYSDRLNNLDILKGNGIDTQHNPELDQMVEKLTQLKSLDITNKATIEFYENEVQKLKNNNEKLTRRLDETLVTLSHCSELSHSTELEYLKNVLYNYMLGKEGLILARVIATVCKFDADQTEEILKKEQQKQTLLSKLGVL